MKIGIDLDDVVFNTTEQVLKVFNNLYNTDVQLSDIVCWDFDKCKQIPEAYKDAIWDIFQDNNVWDNTSVYKDCIDSIYQLSQEHDIFFVTATRTRNMIYKLQLLQMNFPFIEDIDKCLIKAENKQLLNLDVLIDDNMENFKSAAYYGIVFSQEWNKNIDEADSKYCNSNCFRVNSWKEIPQYISFIEEIKS